MSRALLLAAAAAIVLAAPTGVLAQADHADHASHAGHRPVNDAVGDPGRPQTDRERDPDRKPVETVTFAGVKPGDKVIELFPGRGYFTRILSKTVGPKGRVYTVMNPPADPNVPPPIMAVAQDKAYGNIEVQTSGVQEIKVPEKVDLVWTSQNYHDMRGKRMNLDIARTNKSVFDALKPGGVYLVLDHAAAPGAADAPDTLHRIDPGMVRQDLESAGFKFEGESPVLRRTDDDHTKGVRDSGVQGHTDQFIYRFRKPK